MPTKQTGNEFVISAAVERRYPTAASEISSRYRYTGQYEYSELGLYFYQSRWYDASLARFAQADTIVPLATQGVQALDRYAYVNNSPVRYTDNSGHCLWDLCIIEGIGLVEITLLVTTAVLVSDYYASGGPDAVAGGISMLEWALDEANQEVSKLTTLVKDSGPKALTDDEKKHVEKLTKGIDNFLDEHPDLAEEAEKVSEGEELIKGLDHVTEAKNFARGLEKSIEHLKNIREKRTEEAQKAIDEAIAHAQEILEYLDSILGGW